MFRLPFGPQRDNLVERTDDERRILVQRRTGKVRSLKCPWGEKGRNGAGGSTGVTSVSGSAGGCSTGGFRPAAVPPAVFPPGAVPPAVFWGCSTGAVPQGLFHRRFSTGVVPPQWFSTGGFTRRLFHRRFSTGGFFSTGVFHRRFFDGGCSTGGRRYRRLLTGFSQPGEPRPEECSNQATGHQTATAVLAHQQAPAEGAWEFQKGSIPFEPLFEGRWLWALRPREVPGCPGVRRPAPLLRGLRSLEAYRPSTRGMRANTSAAWRARAEEQHKNEHTRNTDTSCQGAATRHR